MDMYFVMIYFLVKIKTFFKKKPFSKKTKTTSFFYPKYNYNI
jgi:hypothetical protein